MLEPWEYYMVAFLWICLLLFLRWYVKNVPRKFLIFQGKTFIALGIVYCISVWWGCTLTPVCVLSWFYMLYKRDDWDD